MFKVFRENSQKWWEDLSWKFHEIEQKASQKLISFVNQAKLTSEQLKFIMISPLNARSLLTFYVKSI